MCSMLDSVHKPQFPFGSTDKASNQLRFGGEPMVPSKCCFGTYITLLINVSLRYWCDQKRSVCYTYNIHVFISKYDVWYKTVFIHIKIVCFVYDIFVLIVISMITTASFHFKILGLVT